MYGKVYLTSYMWLNPLETNGAHRVLVTQIHCLFDWDNVPNNHMCNIKIESMKETKLRAKWWQSCCFKGPSPVTWGWTSVLREYQQWLSLWLGTHTPPPSLFLHKKQNKTLKTLSLPPNHLLSCLVWIGASLGSILVSILVAHRNIH